MSISDFVRSSSATFFSSVDLADHNPGSAKGRTPIQYSALLDPGTKPLSMAAGPVPADGNVFLHINISSAQVGRFCGLYVFGLHGDYLPTICRFALVN
jgi:hypothetical protein